MPGKSPCSMSCTRRYTKRQRSMATVWMCSDRGNNVYIGVWLMPLGISRQPYKDDKPAAQRSGRFPASWQWLCLAGLELYLGCLHVERRFGQQLLELGVLDLIIFQAPCLIGLHAAVLGAPLKERGLAEPVLADQKWYKNFLEKY